MLLTTTVEKNGKKERKEVESHAFIESGTIGFIFSCFYATIYVLNF